MNHMKYNNGTYVLNKDIKNPSPDRRVTGDWRAEPVWESGDKFFIQVWRNDETRIRRIDSYSHQEFIMFRDMPCDALIGNLEPTDENPSLYLKRRGNHLSSLEILDTLVACGRLTWTDMQMAEKTVYDGFYNEYYQTEEPLLTYERLHQSLSLIKK